MRALLFTALCACASPAPSPPVVAVVAVGGGAPVGVINEPLVAGRASASTLDATPATLDATLAETLRLCDAILARCVGRLPDLELGRVKQTKASADADRDELALRNQQVNFVDRNVQTWSTDARRHEMTIRQIAEQHCPAALRGSP